MKEGKVPVTRRRARQCDANEADAHVEILKRADDWVRQKKCAISAGMCGCGAVVVLNGGANCSLLSLGWQLQTHSMVCHDHFHPEKFQASACFSAHGSLWGSLTPVQ